MGNSCSVSKRPNLTIDFFSENTPPDTSVYIYPEVHQLMKAAFASVLPEIEAVRQPLFKLFETLQTLMDIKKPFTPEMRNFLDVFQKNIPDLILKRDSLLEKLSALDNHRALAQHEYMKQSLKLPEFLEFRGKPYYFAPGLYSNKGWHHPKEHSYFCIGKRYSESPVCYTSSSSFSSGEECGTELSKHQLFAWSAIGYSHDNKFLYRQQFYKEVHLLIRVEQKNPFQSYEDSCLSGLPSQLLHTIGGLSYINKNMLAQLTTQIVRLRNAAEEPLGEYIWHVLIDDKDITDYNVISDVYKFFEILFLGEEETKLNTTQTKKYIDAISAIICRQDLQKAVKFTLDLELKQQKLSQEIKAIQRKKLDYFYELISQNSNDSVCRSLFEINNHDSLVQFKNRCNITHREAIEIYYQFQKDKKIESLMTLLSISEKQCNSSLYLHFVCVLSLLSNDQAQAYGNWRAQHFNLFTMYNRNDSTSVFFEKIIARYPNCISENQYALIGLILNPKVDLNALAEAITQSGHSELQSALDDYFKDNQMTSINIVNQEHINLLKIHFRDGLKAEDFLNFTPVASYNPQQFQTPIFSINHQRAFDIYFKSSLLKNNISKISFIQNMFKLKSPKEDLRAIEGGLNILNPEGSKILIDLFERVPAHLNAKFIQDIIYHATRLSFETYSQRTADSHTPHLILVELFNETSGEKGEKTPEAVPGVCMT